MGIVRVILPSDPWRSPLTPYQILSPGSRERTLPVAGNQVAILYYSCPGSFETGLVNFLEAVCQILWLIGGPLRAPPVGSSVGSLGGARPDPCRPMVLLWGPADLFFPVPASGPPEAGSGRLADDRQQWQRPDFRRPRVFKKSVPKAHGRDRKGNKEIVSHFI